MRPDKVIIAPDSFKGALTSREVTDIIAGEVTAAFPGCSVVKMPIADGGEGSVETILESMGGTLYEAQVISPDDRQIHANYGIASDGTAIIEVAQSSGITKQNGLHPMTSSTFGFGQLILAALKQGAREFILCIGGSATTDGGCGMAAALGVRFLNDKGETFIPCGGTLVDIESIDISRIDERIKDCKFTVMCDVDNPLFGETGAAYIYGPQKGATSEQVIALDEGLRHLGTFFMQNGSCQENCPGSRKNPWVCHSERSEESLPLAAQHVKDPSVALLPQDDNCSTVTLRRADDLANTPGAGAAGGLGAGCMAFLGANLVSGIDVILELCGFKKYITDADYVITGEGKLDSQSFSGKVLSGILREAGRVPVLSICGVCDCDEELLRKYNLKVFEASEGISVGESMAYPEKYLRLAAKKAMTYIG